MSVWEEAGEGGKCLGECLEEAGEWGKCLGECLGGGRGMGQMFR